MTDQPDNLILELLRTIRAEQAETNAKLGVMAQSMVSMRKDISGVEVKTDNLASKVGKLDDSFQSLRADVRMIVIAVDEHTHRLDKIEARLDTLCHTPPLN